MESKTIQINLFTKRNRQTDIENKLMITKGKRRGRGINQEFRINRYTLLYIKQINNEDLLYSTGIYIQYLVVTYSGKESEKWYTYILFQILSICICKTYIYV